MTADNCNSSLRFPAFKRLPVEVMARVVSLLDCHSVKALLIALPWLREITMLIRDDPDAQETPVFFNIEGIETILIDKYEFSHRLRSSTMIKLAEMNLRSPGGIHCLSNDKRFWRLGATMDPCTFVHLQGSLLTDHFYASLAGESDFTYGMSINGSHWLVTDNYRESFRACQVKLHITEESDPDTMRSTGPTPPIPASGSVNLDKDSPTKLVGLIPRDQFWLKKLDVQVSNGYFGGLCSRTIEDLTITMYDVGHTGLIEEVHIPGLQELKIFYAHRMPYMRGLCVGPDTPDVTRRYVELTETNSAHYGCGKRPEFLVDIWTRREDYQGMDLSFLASYTDFRLSGIPDFLLDTILQLKNLRQVQWFKTVSFQGEALSLDYTKTYCNDTIHSWFVFVPVPHSRLPRLSFSNLASLDVWATAVGLDLNGVIRCASPYNVSYVHIDVMLSGKNFGGSGHPTISAADIEYIAAYELRNIRLTGCYFGDEENSILASPDAWPTPWIQQRYLHTIVLSPPRSRKKRGSDHLDVKLFKEVFFVVELDPESKIEFFAVQWIDDRPAWLRWHSVAFHTEVSPENAFIRHPGFPTGKLEHTAGARPQ